MKLKSHLFTAKYNWYHALRFSSLCGLINKNRPETELGQPWVTSTNTGSTDHICMLGIKHKTDVILTI